MKNGQMLSQPFTYIFAIVIIALIFLFGFQMIGKLKSTTCNVDNIKFISSMENEIERVYSQGFVGSSNLCALVPRVRASDAPCEIIMPTGIEGICLLYSSMPIEENKIPFKKFADDFRLIQGQTEKNLYFISQDQGCGIEKLSPVKLQKVQIKGTVCAKSGDITKIIIENKGRNVEIRKAE